MQSVVIIKDTIKWSVEGKVIEMKLNDFHNLSTLVSSASQSKINAAYIDEDNTLHIIKPKDYIKD